MAMKAADLLKKKGSSKKDGKVSMADWIGKRRKSFKKSASKGDKHDEQDDEE